MKNQILMDEFVTRTQKLFHYYFCGLSYRPKIFADQGVNEQTVEHIGGPRE